MVRWKLYTTRLFIIWNAHDWGGERLEGAAGCTKGYEMTKLPKAIQN